MNIFLWVVGICVSLVVILFSFVFFNMIFISQITQFKISFTDEYTPLIDGLIVTEIEHDEPALLREKPDTGDLEGAQEMLLYEDDSIKEGRRVFDDDPGAEVLVAENKYRHEKYVFISNEVFQYTEGRKGEKIGSFTSPEFSYIDFVLPVNDRYVLINGSMKDSPYPSERELWQVEYNDLNKTQLSTTPYYSFVRPPKVFIFEDANEQIVVYYTESYSFAFGGDSSRPKYSVVRIYNSEFPQGRDVIKFGFKAGTVLDVIKIDDGYQLIADPSLPAMAEKSRVSPRKWKVVIN